MLSNNFIKGFSKEDYRFICLDCNLFSISNPLNCILCGNHFCSTNYIFHGYSCHKCGIESPYFFNGLVNCYIQCQECQDIYIIHLHDKHKKYKARHNFSFLRMAKYLKKPIKKSKKGNLENNVQSISISLNKIISRIGIIINCQQFFSFDFSINSLNSLLLLEKLISLNLQINNLKIDIEPENIKKADAIFNSLSYIFCFENSKIMNMNNFLKNPTNIKCLSFSHIFCSSLKTKFPSNNFLELFLNKILIEKYTTQIEINEKINPEFLQYINKNPINNKDNLQLKLSLDNIDLRSDMNKIKINPPTLLTVKNLPSEGVKNFLIIENLLDSFINLQGLIIQVQLSIDLLKNVLHYLRKRKYFRMLHISYYLKFEDSNELLKYFITSDSFNTLGIFLNNSIQNKFCKCIGRIQNNFSFYFQVNLNNGFTQPQIDEFYNVLLWAISGKNNLNSLLLYAQSSIQSERVAQIINAASSNSFLNAIYIRYEKESFNIVNCCPSIFLKINCKLIHFCFTGRSSNHYCYELNYEENKANKPLDYSFLNFMKLFSDKIIFDNTINSNLNNEVQIMNMYQSIFLFCKSTTISFRKLKFFRIKVENLKYIKELIMNNFQDQKKKLTKSINKNYNLRKILANNELNKNCTKYPNLQEDELTTFSQADINKLNTFPGLCVSFKDLHDQELYIISIVQKAFKTYKSLNLRNNNISDKGCPIISYFITSIRKFIILDLSNNEITDIGCFMICNAIILRKNFKFLSLENNKIGFLGLIKVAFCLKMKFLTKFLGFDTNLVCNKEAICFLLFADLIDKTKIFRNLNKEFKFSPFFICLDPIKNCISHITCLDLCNVGLDDAGFISICYCLKKIQFYFLRTINVNQNLISDKGILFLPKLFSEYSSVNKLFLNNNLIKNEGAIYIVNNLPSTFVNLKLQENQIGKIGYTEVVKILIKNKRLSFEGFISLSLFEEEDSRELFEKITKYKLIPKNFNFSNRNIEIQKWNHVCKILCYNSYFTEITFTNDGIGVGQLSIILKIISTKKFNSLNLDKNYINEECCILIAEFLQKSNIKSLSLTNNQINSKGLETIGKSLNPGSELEEINVNHNSINLDGLMSFLLITTQTKNLKYLYISQNLIGSKVTLNSKISKASKLSIII